MISTEEKKLHNDKITRNNVSEENRKLLHAVDQRVFASTRYTLFSLIIKVALLSKIFLDTEMTTILQHYFCVGILSILIIHIL